MAVFNIHEEIRKNQIKSVFIIGIFFLFIAFLGAVVGSIISINYTSQIFHLQSILFSVGVAIVISALYVSIFMVTGSKMILSATGAKPASRKHYPHLFHTTEALSIAAGLSTPPQSYVIDDPSLNAYATGFKPEKSYVVVTTGLIKKLNREELEGVIAHEISHIKNQDIKIMLLAAGLVGVTVFLADFLFRMFIFGGLSGGNGGGGQKDGRLMIIMFVFYFILIVTAPIVAQLIKLAISRRREYLADATGAKLTRYPEGLASALEKIKNDSHPELKGANKATAHLFISMPFKRGGLSKLFSTHPPIEERIKILRGQQ